MASSGRDLFRLRSGEIEKSDLDALIADKTPEGFQLEYKRQLDSGDKVLNAISAMANTFGGIILVGFDEERGRSSSQGFGAPGPDGLVGVDPRDKSRLSMFCSNKLVPPFDPEISAIEIGGDKVVLAVRIDSQTCPRPLMMSDRVMVRTESGNRPADLFRLRALFDEVHSGLRAGPGLPQVLPVNHPAFFSAWPADLVLRTVGATRFAPGSWRPRLGDREREALKSSLASSGLSKWLNRMVLGDFGGAIDVNPWIERGGLKFEHPDSSDLGSILERPTDDSDRRVRSRRARDSGSTAVWSATDRKCCLPPDTRTA